jgi:hypothetical protein
MSDFAQVAIRATYNMKRKRGTMNKETYMATAKEV